MMGSALPGSLFVLGCFVYLGWVGVWVGVWVDVPQMKDCLFVCLCVCVCVCGPCYRYNSPLHPKSRQYVWRRRM